jgi:hypothetical protein
MTPPETEKSADKASMPSRAEPRPICEVRVILLENGETVKRGCGQAGLMPGAVGWSCFYCGNYVFRLAPSLYALWFHFKMGREYWRAMSRGGDNFINGVPVSGLPDSLPRRLWGDLSETRPPKWFKYYVAFDEAQFQKYLEAEGL